MNDNENNMNDNAGIIDDLFKVLKPLGKGFTAEVLLAQDLKSDNKLAIKIYFPKGNPKMLEKNFTSEITTMRGVNHQNVVKIFAGNSHGIMKRPGKIEKQIMYMGIELCPGGEFFDYIADPEKGFCENSTRHYFGQLIQGLQAIHGAGLAHRDLKTENLFVDADMNIKIGDFGFAKFIEPENDKALLKTLLGTPGYQCPELLEGNKYNGYQNDIFASGVILFIMYCGFPPFRDARITDPWYRHFINKKPEVFWAIIKKQKRTPPLSESFKELIGGMLAFENRYTLDDVLNSKWMNEKPVDLELVKEDINERKEIVQRNKKKNSEQIDVHDQYDESNEKVYRGGDGEESNEDLVKFNEKFGELVFQDFEIGKWNDTEFRYNVDYMRVKKTPKNLLKDICSRLLQKYPGIYINLYKNRYKGSVLFVPKVQDLDEVEDISEFPPELEFEFEVYEDEDDRSVLQFAKNETMNQYDFKNFYKEFRQEFEQK